MRVTVLTLLLAAAAASSRGQAEIVINEVQYDDMGSTTTDDREFVELYNNGGAAVDISGWTLGGRDNSGLNQIVSITGIVGSGTTMLAAGGYYVIGQSGVPRLNQSVGANFLENDGETLELYSGAFGVANLQDALVYEGFNGETTDASSYGLLNAALQAQVNGGPVWGIYNPPDGATGLTPVTLARYVDGHDTNNNGRDFGLRPSTPGIANSTTVMARYVAPNPDGLANGAVVPDHVGSFVGLRVMTPGVVLDGLNQNAIPALPGFTKALTAWDGAGGGNAIVTSAVFAGGRQRFDLSAYIDTANLPVSTNGAGTPFRGSELSFYGLGGSIDANVGGSPSNLSNISGAVTTVAANSAIGATGVAWYYEKVGESAVGAGNISEKLYLIDAGDGGNMNAAAANATPEEWTVLATIDLSTTASGWHRLSIEIDEAGGGLARFDAQTFNFTTAAGLYGSMYIGYRENTGAGADGTPTYLRPPTFNQFVPTEPDADFNDDLYVNGEDFLIWQANFGGAGNDTTGDSTGDGQVTGEDFDQWQGAFGSALAAPAGSPVPEPATWLGGLLAISVGLAASRLSKRRPRLCRGRSSRRSRYKRRPAACQ